MSSLDYVAGRYLPGAHAPANALADQFLHFVLFVTIASSFFVVFEPAPFEYLAFVLAFACILDRIPFNRVIVPLFVLFLIRDGSGALGLLQIVINGYMRLTGQPYPLYGDVQYLDSIRFLGVSFYLGMTCVMLACIVSQDTMRRVATLRSAYILAAVTASALGTLGYFSLNFSILPGMDFFTLYGRATGGFKGPNDLGGFLIAPLLWLIQGFITDKIRLRNLIACIIIFVGLLLTFSRGAWLCSLFGVIALFYVIFVTQNDRRTRNRLILFMVAGVVVALAIYMLLTSVDAVNQMIASRSHLQDYDINGDNRSRLQLQELSFEEMLLHPLGMGPWGFAHATNIVSHNTYLGTAVNHGWIGGAAYLTILVLTLMVGFRALWLRTPWQQFLLPTYIAFVTMLFEGYWGDTDHWRHFYILLGLVWGLAAATQKVVWRARAANALSEQFINGRVQAFEPRSE